VFDANFQGRGVTMKVTSVTGHIMGFDFTPDFKSWTRVNPERLLTGSAKKFFAD
jgi:DNA topoisomerase IA